MVYRMRLSTLISWIAPLAIVATCWSCSQGEYVALSNENTVLHVPREFLLASRDIAANSGADNSQSASAALIIPASILAGPVEDDSRAIHGLVSIYSESELGQILQTSERIRSEELRDIVNLSGRFMNGGAEVVTEFDGTIFYEDKKIRKSWVLLRQYPPSTIEDVIANCADLEFFADCRFHLFAVEEIVFELTIPAELLAHHQEIVESMVSLVLSWKEKQTLRK